LQHGWRDSEENTGSLLQERKGKDPTFSPRLIAIYANFPTNYTTFALKLLKFPYIVCATIIATLTCQVEREPMSRQPLFVTFFSTFLLVFMFGFSDLARAAETAAVSPTPTASPTSIAIFGDSLADGLWSGLSTVIKRRCQDCRLYRHSKIGAGLTRPDYLTWFEGLPQSLDEEKPQIAVFMIGANDRQGLRDVNRKGYLFRSEGWRGIYAARIKSLIDLMRDRDIKVVWVGLPIMLKEEDDKDARYLDEVFETAAKETGVQFLGLSHAFADEEGKFTTHQADSKGKPQQIRHSDGVHFTGYGYELLANKAWQEVERLMKAQKDAQPNSKG
jgi:hypothetical protein